MCPGYFLLGLHDYAGCDLFVVNIAGPESEGLSCFQERALDLFLVWCLYRLLM